ncbi:hypothetical protein SKAU_G00314110 [Synaphobranchus kaupii]|uniref:OCEL domain-containing protein n=1 Tax=Synaphobranchus kaupii TaxID=118154 RepID=A0A9Q1ILI9_SYNKA|nr:hypothetical protein SKAU_G00314110 [Synaphobranchus kaupii]
MAALRPEHRYGLSCGKINKNISNKTLYHVKLTDTAIRALEAYQNLKGTLPNQPAICFQGNQGYIKIPAPSSDHHGALRVFSFYLSSDSKDKPQASFDCIHQYVSGENREQLEYQGSVQDKITVCATEDSYQMTRERMSQVEKDIWSRTAIEIKPGSTYASKYVKMPKKQAPPPTTDSLHRHSPSNRRGGVPSTVAQRSLRDRLLHLLALKPYRKPELLLWLDRERASPKDKTDLGSVLEEVAKLNPKDHSFTLKDELYPHIQKDWPGYQDEERQLLHRLMARKTLQSSSSQSKSFQPNPSFQKTSEDSPLHLSPGKNLAVKRPLPPGPLDGLSQKRQRVSDPAPPPPLLSNGSLVPGGARGPATLHPKTETQRTGDHTSESRDGFPAQHKLNDPAHKPAPPSPKLPQTDPPVCTDQHATNDLHRKKKSKKHKEKEKEKEREKERERLKDSGRSEWLETSPDLKPDLEKHHEQGDANTPASPPSPAEPDYLLKYTVILASEQRQKYKEDFCAEYDEYRDLHARIGSVTQMFVRLGSKMKTLSPGTKEHKVMGDQILEKYKKYMKKFPGYREEKRRCEYLHQKLSHIKHLILDYDQTDTPL